MKKLKVYKGFVYLAENAEDLKQYLQLCKDDSLLTFDWETTGLAYNCTPLGLALNSHGRESLFCPIDYFFTKGLSMKEVASICNKEFKRLRLIAHNAKFDSMVNIMNGIKDESCNIVADTLIMIHLVNPILEKQLEGRVKEDFDYAKPTFEEIITEHFGRKRKWTDVDWANEGDELLELLARYAGEDAFWETQVYNKYKNLLDEDAWNVLNKIEMPMVNILRDAKIRGVLIDIPLLEDFGSRAQEALERAMDGIYDEAGCIFNINSSKQKREVFFDKLKLPIISSTKTGEPSTDADSAEEWAEMGYPIGEALVKYSELNKLITGYINSIPQLVDKENVLRGDLNSCGTRTGRMSSSNPNLQNQPNNKDFPIRSAFIPRPGYVFINYDYSQLELRVMAHMSKDEKFRHIFETGGDPHGDVAKRCGLTRKQAKVMNFGVLYGMGPDKYERTFGVTRERAIQMIDDYHKTYDGFARWKTSTENFAKKNGYVKNLFGRKRILSEAAKNSFSSGFDKRRYFGELRQSVNTIIQGTGADIVKRATIDMCRKFKEADIDAHFLLQVHDEVLVEARIDQALDAEKFVIEAMQNSTKLCVPLLVDGKIIQNWGEMKSDDIPTLFSRFDYSLYGSII